MMYLDRVGAESRPERHTWEPDECALYAIAVGAGMADEAFTLDTFHGKDQLVYPTFVLAGVLAAESATWPDPGFMTGDYDWDDLVLGEQSIVLHRSVPAIGDVNVVTRVGAIYDKGSGALVVLESVATDNTTRQPMFTASTGVFVIGQGSFGGERGPAVGESTAVGRTTLPERAPDATLSAVTSPVQTLLYRYAGNDRNPLHSEPETAHKHGFREPILMGQNTLGFACRAIVHALADGDPSRVRSVSGRFAAAGYNGDTLVTEMWHGAGVACDGRDDAVVLFRVVNQSGDVLVDRGRATVTPNPGRTKHLIGRIDH
jgi:acyl dehydratase